MRCNSAINDSAQTAILLEGASHGFNIEPGKIRDGKPFASIGVTLEDTKPEGFKFDGLALRTVDIEARAVADAEAALSADMATILAMVQSSPGGRYAGGKASLVELAPCGKARAGRALAQLVARDVVYEQTEHGRKAVILTPPKAP